MMKVGMTALVLFCLAMATPAFTEELFSYFEKSEDPAGASITISPCKADEVTECEAQILSCEQEWQSLEFTIIVGNVEKIASGLIVGTQGIAEGMLRLSEGASITIEITNIEAVTNELDGGWTLTLGFANSRDLFEAIGDKSGEGGEIELAGERFPIAPQPGDGAKLAQLRAACQS
jgi:hypothetical protein